MHTDFIQNVVAQGFKLWSKGSVRNLNPRLLHRDARVHGNHKYKKPSEYYVYIQQVISEAQDTYKCVMECGYTLEQPEQIYIFNHHVNIPGNSIVKILGCIS